MKKLIVLFLMMVSTITLFGQLKREAPFEQSRLGAVFAQSKLDAPIGLTFGQNIDIVKLILDKKGEYVDTTNVDYGTVLTYSNINLEYLTSEIIICKFVGDSLFEVDMLFRSTIIHDIEKKYDEVCNIVISIYGEGDSFRSFKYPYSDKSSDLIEALMNGSADIKTRWQFMFLEEDAVSAQIIEYDQSLYVKVSWQNGKLINKVLKSREAIEKVE